MRRDGAGRVAQGSASVDPLGLEVIYLCPSTRLPLSVPGNGRPAAGRGQPLLKPGLEVMDFGNSSWGPRTARPRPRHLSPAPWGLRSPLGAGSGAAGPLRATESGRPSTGFATLLNTHPAWALLFHYPKSQRNHPAGSISRRQPDSFLVLY